MARRRRKKKAEFEMLIISFCDIITISTAALLLALFVTVQLAIKIPVFRPTPRSAPSTKQAFFFECRNDHLFFVDKAGLDEQVEELMSKLNPGVRGGDLGSFQKAIQGQEVGNLYYKVDPRYLLVGRMVLETRAGTSGEGAGDLENPKSKYQAMLSLLDKDKQYIAFWSGMIVLTCFARHATWRIVWASIRAGNCSASMNKLSLAKAESR
jgi:hypothetical protein